MDKNSPVPETSRLNSYLTAEEAERFEMIKSRALAAAEYGNRGELAHAVKQLVKCGHEILDRVEVQIRTVASDR